LIFYHLQNILKWQDKDPYIYGLWFRLILPVLLKGRDCFCRKFSLYMSLWKLLIVESCQTIRTRSVSLCCLRNLPLPPIGGVDPPRNHYHFPPARPYGGKMQPDCQLAFYLKSQHILESTARCWICHTWHPMHNVVCRHIHTSHWTSLRTITHFSKNLMHPSKMS